VNWLWDVLEKEFNEEEKSRFLKVFDQMFLGEIFVEASEEFWSGDFNRLF